MSSVHGSGTQTVCITIRSWLRSPRSFGILVRAPEGGTATIPSLLRRATSKAQPRSHTRSPGNHLERPPIRNHRTQCNHQHVTRMHSLTPPHLLVWSTCPMGDLHKNTKDGREAKHTLREDQSSSCPQVVWLLSGQELSQTMSNFTSLAILAGSGNNDILMALGGTQQQVS